MAQPSFLQYGNKMVRNPNQRLSASQPVAGPQRAVSAAAKQVVGSRSLPLATRILPALLARMGPLMAGAGLANNILDKTNLGSFTNPRKAY